MAVETTAGAELALRRKRLRYRAWHRGTREMDILLGSFADANLDRFDVGMLDRFESLIGEADTELTEWLMGRQPIPGHIDADLIADILADHRQRVGS
jgi:antitoxin CptB